MVEKLPRMREHLLDKDLVYCCVCCEKVAVWILSAKIGIVHTVQPFTLFWSLVYTLACTTSVSVFLSALNRTYFISRQQSILVS